MEKQFSMEWKMSTMEWKKFCSMEYGKIVFHSIACPGDTFLFYLCLGEDTPLD